MRLRVILAANLRRIIGTSSVRAWAMSRGIDVRLVDRICKAEHGVTLDVLERVADAAGVPAWWLIDPDSAHDDPRPPHKHQELISRLRQILAQGIPD